MNNERQEMADVEELTIGRWDKAWQRFMQENYPTEAEELMNSNRWDELALEIDREAYSLWELLRKQYSKANPRPTTFMETMKWENTRGVFSLRKIKQTESNICKTLKRDMVDILAYLD